MYNNILIEQKGQVLTITINRPNQLNALNKETISELNQALSVANDDNRTGVVILTGSGEKSFVAGADIKNSQILRFLKVVNWRRMAKTFDSFIENMKTHKRSRKWICTWWRFGVGNVFSHSYSIFKC